MYFFDISLFLDKIKTRTWQKQARGIRTIRFPRQFSGNKNRTAFYLLQRYGRKKVATALAPIRRCRYYIFYGKRNFDPDAWRLAHKIL
jgi:hypothetical protein